MKITEDRIIRINNQGWEKVVTNYIFSLILTIKQRYNCCSIVLTGGRTATTLYKEMFNYQKISSNNLWSEVSIFFTDERCVDSSSELNNYKTIFDSLFKNETPNNCFIHRINTEMINYSDENYNDIFPDSPDILLLTLAEDGHIASIFPGSEIQGEYSRKISKAKSPKFPYDRISITPMVIKNSKNILVLANGSDKKAALDRFNNLSCEIENIPISLLFEKAIFFTDN